MGIKYKVISDRPAFTEKSEKGSEDLHLDYRELRDFSSRKERYFQIDKNSLIPGTTVNFGLFKQKGMEFEAVIKASNKSPALINEEVLNRFFDDTAFEIVIEKSDIGRYHDYLKSLQELPKRTADEKTKAIAIKENSKILMKELLDDPRSGEKIKEVKNTVDTITDAIVEDKETMHNMITLSKYDYYTYTHCVNVAVLSIGLGITTGLSSDDVKVLGIGAMLHDVGKTAIPAEILNKQGKLDEYEYKRIQEHVREGEKILRETEEFPEEAFDAVLQHHEKLSGKGYPFKLKGKDIRLFGRITAIADCYDALTTRRPYKPAFRPYDALTVISKEHDNYDRELLTDFVKMLGGIKE
jgi:putative nucleotidyltransferase with HDIG domain